MSRPINQSRRDRWRHMSPRERAENSEFDPRVLRGCSGKERHPSKRTALGVARVLTQQGRQRPGWVLQAYKCRHCGGWHIGNSHDRQRRRAEDSDAGF